MQLNEAGSQIFLKYLAALKLRKLILHFPFNRLSLSTKAAMKSHITKSMKAFLQINPKLAELLKQTYYSLPIQLRNLMPLEDAQTYIQLQLKPLFRKCFFVKIGANDGVTSDPLHFLIKKYDWTGVMVEPVKSFFDRLAANYRDRPGIALENCAIANTNSLKDFYYVQAAQHLPRWIAGIGSFSRETLLTHKVFIPDLERYVVAEKIPCLTLHSLFEKHQVQSIDLLHIDTEGYDYEIIRMIDFSKIKPLAILYETKHLSSSDQIACIALLKQQNYQLLDFQGDMLAYSW